MSPRPASPTCSTTTTPASHLHDSCGHRPTQSHASLHPPSPSRKKATPTPLLLPQARIASHPVLWHGGTKLKTRHVLEPVTVTVTTTTEGGAITAVTPRTDLPSYVISQTLSKRMAQGSKSVALLLATEARRHEDGDATPHLVRVGPLVAIKISPLPDSLVPDHSLREVTALQQLADHNPGAHHITPLLHAWQDDEHVYTVLPFLCGGDLRARVLAASHRGHLDAHGGGLPPGEAASYLRQIAEGLRFMKLKGGLAHGDLKLDNVMLDGSGVASLIDLGMAVRVPPGLVGQEGPATGGGLKERRPLIRPHRYMGKAHYARSVPHRSSSIRLCS